MGRWGETMGWTALINTSKRDHTYGKIGETMGKKKRDMGRHWSNLG